MVLILHSFRSLTSFPKFRLLQCEQLQNYETILGDLARAAQTNNYDTVAH